VKANPFLGVQGLHQAVTWYGPVRF